MQALQRKQPGLALRPGQVERREYEYIRHGTLSFMVNFEVASGQIGTVSVGPTRTEEDYVQHIQRTVEAEPAVKKWHFMSIISTSTSPKGWFGMWRPKQTWRR